MKKRPLQILVVSLLAILIVGGIFLNNKYAKVAMSETNNSSEIQADKTADSAGKTSNTDVKKEKSAEKEKTKLTKEETKSSKVKEKATKETIESNKDKQLKNNEKTKQEKSQVAKNEKINEQQTIDNSNKTTVKGEATKSGETPVPHPNKSSAKQPNTQPNKGTVKPSSQPSKPSNPSKPTPENKPQPEAKKEITLSIRGTVANSSTYFISPQKVTIKEGESVMDVLGDFCRDNGIQVGIRNGNYVAGINNLYEFDKGSESGWLYRVNGVFPSYGAAQYTLKVGDTIEWMYTEDLGHDVGAPQG